MAIYPEPGGPAVCQVVIPRWANFFELRHGEFLRIPLLGTPVNNPINQRMSNARKVPSEHQLRPPAQVFSNQAMPSSVILNTVVPTRVALGLGSMQPSASR